MRFSLVPALIALALPFINAEDDRKPLEIEYTHKVECERKTTKGDRIDVHYSGTLTDGKKFDSSFDRNQPLTFVVGRGDVIKGWDEGLLDMCPGEKRKLTIQPIYGYGMRAVGPIPANSILIFETELVANHGKDHSHEEL